MRSFKHSQASYDSKEAKEKQGQPASRRLVVFDYGEGSEITRERECRIRGYPVTRSRISRSYKNGKNVPGTNARPVITKAQDVSKLHHNSHIASS